MAELLIGFIQNTKSFNFAIDAIEELVPKLLEAYQEIEARFIADGQVLTDAVDNYVAMMGEGYDLAQAKIDLGLSTLDDEPDYTVPSLPEHIYIELPAFSIAIDLKQIGEDFVTMFAAASRKVEALFENLGFITVLSDKFDELLDAIAIPFTNNLNYIKATEVPIGEEPEGEWIIDSWFDYNLNETTDVWQVVGKGEDFTPEMNISILILWKALVYWKMFKLIYKIAKKLGIVDLAKKFAAKAMKIPKAMFSRYSMNKKLRKSAALTTVQTMIQVKPEMDQIDAYVDTIESEISLIKIDITDISKRLARSSIGFG